MTNPNDSIHSSGSSYDPAELQLEKQSLGQFKAQLKYHGGLTKREWFAGMAMQGMIFNGDAYVDLVLSSNKNWSERAVIAADALIAELNKSEEKK